MNLIIRPLEKKEVESVGKIFDQYWNDSFRNNLSFKLEKYFQNDPVLESQNFRFFVAEKDGQIVGVDAIRNIPDHMVGYSSTSNPIEWYVAAVKNVGTGIGIALMSHTLEVVKNEGHTEILFFSGESHQNAWKFHDKYFERVSRAVAPNGERGYIWRKVIVE